MESFIAGSIGGGAGVIVGHPFDTIKCRLQTQGSSGYMLQYKGPLHCGLSITKTEGIRALYKGLTTPIMTMSALNAVLFGTYSKSINYIQPGIGDMERIKLSTCFAATLVSAIVVSPLTCTIELLKIRLQVEGIGKYYYTRYSTNFQSNTIKGPLQLIVKILKEEGTRGLFKGLPSTLAREATGFMGYFIPYEFLCRYMAGDRPLSVLQPYQLALVGGFAGMLTWAISFPFDVVKSRIQVDGIQGPPQYNGMVDCFCKSYHSEGWRVFFKGLGVTVFRAFPVNATTFSVVTVLLRLFRGEEHNAVL